MMLKMLLRMFVSMVRLPDLLITFTYNQAWDEIQQLLLQGQSAGS